MNDQAWNRRAHVRVMRLPKWQIVLLLVVFGSIAVAVALVAAGVFLEGSGEELLILAEHAQGTSRAKADLASAVRQAVLAGIGLNPYHIEVLEPGTLPRTSSGKLRRSEAQRQFLAGELTGAPVSSLRLMAQLARSQVSWARFHVQKAIGSGE